MKKCIINLIAVLMVLSSSCATITYNAAAVDKMVQMNRTTANYEVVGQFDYQPRAVFLVFSLITIKDAELDKGIRDAISINGGNGIANLKIEEVYSGTDVGIGLLQSLLLFIQVVDTRTIKISGDIVKYDEMAGNFPTVEEQLEAAIEVFNSDEDVNSKS